MTLDYRHALQKALDDLRTELEAEEGPAKGPAKGQAKLRTPRGARIVLERIVETSFEKLVCLGRRVSVAGGTVATLKGGALAAPLAVKLWHMRTDWRGDGEDDDAVAERMRRRSGQEHSRIRKLAGCKHWLQLAADVASENAACIGAAEYPAIYLEYFPGKDLTELLQIDEPPPKERRLATGVSAGDDAGMYDDDDDDDDDDDEEEEEEEGDGDGDSIERRRHGATGGGARGSRRASWEASRARFTPEQLGLELQTIKDFSLGILLGMKEAHGVGLRFECDGSEGPFVADVRQHEGKVKLVDVESLGEYEDGDDQRFTAEPLVYSPVGEFVRSWWLSTAAKLHMAPNSRCSNPDFQRVLDRYGAMNWLLFKWKPAQLQGDEIIRLLTHGPQAQAQPAYEPALEARWAEFMQRAFVVLGPRRFDEVKEVTEMLQQGQIEPAELVARTRYVMGKESESLYREYLAILKKLGYAVTKPKD